ncbi:hypothetical protein BGZ63DRAFT_399188 [Mariannaea sp. PMI_226]|nr:hypothetical protein BGZ63DRAFT_399188 [Mariannaea sp. PMI_226]
MRPDFALLAFSLFASASASAIDPSSNIKNRDLAANTEEHDLFKRRGGGGGGGRGGGGGGGGHSTSSGKKSSSSSSNSGKSSGSKSSGSKSGSKSSNSNSQSNSNTRSNSGGSSSSGSGPPPTYGGGRYYPGGAAVPYRAGSKTPGGIVPFVLVGSALAFWPGVWLYGAYMYHYNNPYHYYNASSKANETRDVICGCSYYGVCGCNDNNDTSYYNELIGNGSYASLNKSIVDVAKVNGTETILINGTLPNGTTVKSDDSAAGGGLHSLIEALGFWPAIAAVLATVFLA